MVKSKEILASISSYAGNRFDLVQAGGGNSSVKLDNEQMLIKSSGISLSEVTSESGFVCVNYSYIRDYLATTNFDILNKKQREQNANKAMLESMISALGKPSIETFLHALLDTVTLHTHPISVNILTAQEDWKSTLLDLWPEAVCVPYQTPGIDLALALIKEITAFEKDHGNKPRVIFLQNHGLIVSSSNHAEVLSLTDAVTLKIENQLTINLSRYRRVSQLQTLFLQLGEANIKLLCNDDKTIEQALSSESQAPTIWPFCPDTLIYCGVHPVFITSDEDYAVIASYQERYQEIPKVLVIDNTVYFCAKSLKLAKDAQDLFKFHLLVTQHSEKTIQRLTMDEVAYLSNWDAEKYRQEV